MSEQYQIKALRYLIDPDGDTKKDIATRISAGGLSGEWFGEFDVKSNTFSPSAYTDIFDFALEYFQRYNELITDDVIRNEIIGDTELRTDQKRDLIELITEICDEPYKPQEFEYVRSKIQDEYVLNYSIHIYKAALKKSSETDDPIGSLDYVQRNITDLKARVNPSKNKLDSSMQLWQLAEIKQAEFDKEGTIIKPTATFGFPKWDMVFGGLFAEEVTVLAGPKNSFKSGLMNRIIIHNIFSGKRVVWATRENSIQQNWNRLMAFMTGIPLTKINTNNLDDLEKSVLRASMQELVDRKDNVLIIPPTECQTIDMLKSRIQLHFGNENPELIGLDHIGRLQPSRRTSAAKWEKMDAIAEETKDMVSFFQCPLITPAHLNRKGNKGESADLDDVQFDSISQIVDNMFICKPDLERPWEPPEPGEFYGKPGILNCTVARARNQPKGIVLQLEVETSVCMARDYDLRGDRPEELEKIRREKLKK